MHKEDIKAAIRKRYGSLLAFELAKGLPATSVKDVLRGRAVWQARVAIAEEVGLPVEQLFQVKRAPRVSMKRDGSKSASPSHHLNREAA